MYLVFLSFFDLSTQGQAVLKKMLSQGICTSIFLLNSGCAFNLFQTKPIGLVTQDVVNDTIRATPTALTEEATQLLLTAEQKINNARNSLALWTSAIEKFTLARQAAAAFDSDKTTQLARETIALCEFSLAQTKLPLVNW